MSEVRDRFPMATDFEGLISLLAKHLYSEPDIFLRELIQNAHDAIVMRQAVDRDHAGRIDVDYDVGTSTIRVTDNGIGLDEADIRKFLAVIGATNKREHREHVIATGRHHTNDVIGQFGIGMLSAFVVADCVTVDTLKLDTTQAFRWENHGSDTCELYDSARRDLGTTVTVHVTPSYQFLMDAPKLRSIIVKYMDFLPFEIYLQGEGPINTVTPPWHRSHWTSEAEKQQAYRDFLNRRFPDIPLDVIPIEIDEPYSARGALFISDRHVPDIATAGVVDIYVKRAFVRADDHTLLPKWAKFVRGVIDSSGLKPNAARDNIQRDDPVCIDLQKRLGSMIVDRLRYLALHDRDKFKNINHWHHYHLVGMAAADDSFFEAVVDLLLFETNRGKLSLPEYLTKNPTSAATRHKVPIYYTSSGGAANLFYQLADARGLVVIDAGNTFVEPLLQKYSERRENAVVLVRLDETDDPDLFRPLAEASLKPQFELLEHEIERLLRDTGVSVATREFAPETLPCALLLSPKNRRHEELKTYMEMHGLVSGFRSVAKDSIQNVPEERMRLFLNARNPIVSQLLGVERGSSAMRELLVGLYNCAFLGSRTLLTDKNAETLHAQFVRLMQSVLEQNVETGRLRQQLESERAEALALRERHGGEVRAARDHILVFLITPYSREYSQVEQAIREVFESPPYYFEVQVARDFTLKPSLLENVGEHIRQADAFIAEITDLNENVMFELGAAMMQSDGRPVFCMRRTDATKSIPADLRDMLRFDYGSINDAVDVLAAGIRKGLEFDGRPSHVGIRTLLERRKKRFLSRTSLRQLRVALRDQEQTIFLRQFGYVEDLVARSATDVAQATGMAAHIAAAIQGELREMADLNA